MTGAGIWARRELLGNLVARDLKSRYKGSALGFLWSLLTPLFMALIYLFFLRLLAGRGVPMEEIIIGVFAWQFTVQSVQSGMSCITGHSNLVKKVFFPRLVLPTASTLANLVNFLLSLIVQFVLLFVLMSMRGAAPSAAAWALPLVILLHTLFNLSLALLLAAANVFFRDTQHLVGLFLSAWFFVSPVMYNLSFMNAFATDRPWLMHLYMLNPLAGILTAYRALILPGVFFPWSAWSVAGLLWPLALFVLSVAVFQRAQRNFSDLL